MSRLENKQHHVPSQITIPRDRQNQKLELAQQTGELEAAAASHVYVTILPAGARRKDGGQGVVLPVVST